MSNFASKDQERLAIISAMPGSMPEIAAATGIPLGRVRRLILEMRPKYMKPSRCHVVSWVRAEPGQAGTFRPIIAAGDGIDAPCLLMADSPQVYQKRHAEKIGQKTRAIWSDEERALLRSNYVSRGMEWCMAHLPGRTRANIRSKAANMKLSPKVFESDMDRFSSKVRVTPGCWIWIGSRFANKGYGQFNVAGKNWQAHRYSYTKYIGEIPSGLCVCHKCDNPSCVNPDHFFLGTTQENTADRVAKGRTSRILGEKNKVSKLTNADVYEIRATLDSHEDAAKRFGVSASNICMIRSRKSWAHLPERSDERAK